MKIAEKNSAIQARFETKESGTKSRRYLVTLLPDVKATVIFNDGETLEQALECMRQHYGERLKSVEAQ